MSEQYEPVPIPVPQPMALPRFPVRITYGLIALNILVFLLDQLVGQRVTMFGALMPALVVVYRQWWRLIAAGFLHANLVHIALNAYAVYGLGSLMERFYGPRRFGVVYALALVGSSVLVTLLSGFDVPTVGASGAIMGVLGAMLVYFWRYRNALTGGRHYLSELGRMALINVGIGLVPGISLWGHLGGLLAGAAAGFAMLPRYSHPGSPSVRLALRRLTTRDWLVAGLVVAAEAVLLGLAFLTRHM